MIRATTAIGFALAVSLAGAATAQQGMAAGSGGTEDEVGAPASAGTGVKGVYSMKSMMGISTGSTASEDEAAAGGDEEGSVENRDKKATSD